MTSVFSSETIPEQVDCLRKMFARPRRSTQRVVEQLTFSPSGGLRWVRTLQIHIPPNATPAGQSWRVVSLGLFRRRRYADLAAYDANGARLSLLTRYQHGTILSGAILEKHFSEFKAELEQLSIQVDSSEHETYRTLLSDIFAHLTSAGDVPSPDGVAEQLASMYECLLGAFDTPPPDLTDRRDAFRANLEDSLTSTQYLCWLKAAAGDVVNVQTCYTARDDKWRRPDWIRRKNAASATQSRRLRRRERTMSLFGTFGLAPLRSELRVPNSAIAGSYYLTLEPPENTEITYLDWQSGNSVENDLDELDSSALSVHFHHDQDSQPDPAERSRVVRMFLRGTAHAHKQIAIGAVLNLIFVILVASGHLTDAFGSSTQTWLLVTPTILTAYLADQQRHYYAWATRRQRAILWSYLLVSIGFLVTTSFRLAESVGSRDTWRWYDNATAWLLLVASAAVFVWYGLLGYSFRVFTERRTKKAFDRSREGTASLEQALELKHAAGMSMFLLAKRIPRWKIYENVVYSHCKFMVTAVACACLLSIAAIVWRWDTAVRHKPATPVDVAFTLPDHICGTCTMQVRLGNGEW